MEERDWIEYEGREGSEKKTTAARYSAKYGLLNVPILLNLVKCLVKLQAQLYREAIHPVSFHYLFKAIVRSSAKRYYLAKYLCSLPRNAFRNKIDNDDE